jgi:hypothetical protein
METNKLIEQQKKGGKLVVLTLSQLKEITDKFLYAGCPDEILNRYNIIFVNGVVLSIVRDEEIKGKATIEEKEVLG